MRSIFIVVAGALMLLPAAASGQDRAPPAPPVGGPLRSTLPADDLYDPLGIRSAGYVLFAAIRTTVRASNKSGPGGGEEGASLRTTPEIDIRSQWLRHQLSLALRGTHETYLSGDADDSYQASADLTARLDLADAWTANLRAGYGFRQQSVSDPNFPAGADDRPGVHTVSGSAGVVNGAGRLRVETEARVVRTIYEDGNAGGVVVDQGDRTNTVGALRLRVGPSLAMVTPFAEAELSRRIYDRTVDSGGLRRAETGQAFRAGVAVDRGPVLSGEISAGFARHDFDDAALRTLSGATVDGTLVWSPSAPTTVTTRLSTAFNPSANAASSGSLTRALSVELAHEVRRNVTVRLQGEVDRRQEEGTGVDEVGATVGVAAVWRPHRHAEVTASYAHDWLDSSDAGRNFRSDTVSLGLRLRR